MTEDTLEDLTNRKEALYEKLVKLKQQYASKVEEYTETENRLANMKLSSEEEFKEIRNKRDELKQDIQEIIKIDDSILAIDNALFQEKTYQDNRNTIDTTLMTLFNIQSPHLSSQLVEETETLLNDK